MGSLEKVPCIHVDSTNIDYIWPQLLSSIQSCHWISIDLELSGIGPRTNFGLNNIEDRYQAFCQVVKTRSILSMGISLFEHVKVLSSDDERTHDNLIESNAKQESKEWTEDEERRPESIEWPYCVKSYNIFCLCQDEYETESEAQKFLENHGFDFEKQKESGLRYNRDIHSDGLCDSSSHMEKLFEVMISSEKPLVVHNGFVDFLFLYHNFYMELPKNVQTFISDLYQMFPMGIYDTKYITDSIFDFKSSFLEYIYYDRQRFNVERIMKGETHIFIHFDDDLDQEIQKNFIEVRNMKTKIFESNTSNIEICKHYSSHGWCKDGVDCKFSHNIDLILDRKKKKAVTKTKRNRKSRKTIQQLKNLSLFNESLADDDDDEDSKDHNGVNCDDSSQTPIDNTSVKHNDCDASPTQTLGRVKSGAHRSGYDAFMTGYAFGTFLYVYCENQPCQESLDPKTPGLKDLVNNLFLSGKDHPLKIRPSHFSKPSVASRDKLSQIRFQGLSQGSVHH